MTRLAACLVVFLALAGPQVASPATFLETFDGGTISPLLSFTSQPAGFGFSLADDHLTLTKNAGVGNGFELLTTNFMLFGDFLVTVELSRDNLNGLGEAGLTTLFPSGFSDVWSLGPSQIVGNIFVPDPPGLGTGVIGDSTSTVTLQIQRMGTTLTESFDPGTGLQTVHSATAEILADPVRVQLFLGQKTGNTSAHAASFDNLFIQADSFSQIPLPSALALLAFGVAAATGLRHRVRHR